MAYVLEVCMMKRSFRGPPGESGGSPARALRDPWGSQRVYGDPGRPWGSAGITADHSADISLDVFTNISADISAGISVDISVDISAYMYSSIHIITRGMKNR